MIFEIAYPGRSTWVVRVYKTRVVKIFASSIALAKCFTRLTVKIAPARNNEAIKIAPTIRLIHRRRRAFRENICVHRERDKKIYLVDADIISRLTIKAKYYKCANIFLHRCQLTE